MAFITYRISRGKKYWSIVESRRINGKPKQVILEYIGTAETLLQRLLDKEKVALKSYSHGDTYALVNIAKELDLINIINKHIPPGEKGDRPIRDGLTVGASFVLAAIGRACRPTSKMGWYQWCKTTSLEYCLKTSFKKLDSQHFWDQMGFLPTEQIYKIENEIVKQLISAYQVKLDCLFFDTTNFFTFIDSANNHCQLPQRGKNKQKRYDLRQIGMALLVTRKDRFPLFHRTYRGNKNDITVFKEVFADLTGRLQSLTKELEDVTLVFDKGNNSRDNFKLIDKEQELHYVAGLVPSYFTELIKKANKNFQTMTINGETVPVYRTKEDVWGQERTCVVTVSKQLKEGQIRGIHQHLEKKYKELEKFKKQLENPKKRKTFDMDEIKTRLKKIIKGQYIDIILKYESIEFEDGSLSPKTRPCFTYYLDQEKFERLKAEVLGRKILITNRHDWTSEEIISAYRGQSKVEQAFENLKNPFHLAVRPQYHWTDQKIKAHIFMCIIGYLLTIAAYTKAREKAGYKRNISNFMDDLRNIRLACSRKSKSNKVNYQLEAMPKEINKATKTLAITDNNIRIKLNLSVYK